MFKSGTKVHCFVIISLVSFILFLGVFPSPSIATTIRAVTFAELLKYSEFVFEGRVVAVETGIFSGSYLPRTCVMFEIIEVIKGEHSDNSVDLCFMGGISGKYTVQVTNMQYPKLGEKGIYFVKSLTRSYSNPLYGWKQGHFLIETDPNTAREYVMTAGRQPVAGLTLEAAPFTALSTGVARGVQTTGPLQKAKAWTVEEFKRNLRSMLEAEK